MLHSRKSLKGISIQLLPTSTATSAGPSLRHKTGFWKLYAFKHTFRQTDRHNGIQTDKATYKQLKPQHNENAINFSNKFLFAALLPLLCCCCCCCDYDVATADAFGKWLPVNIYIELVFTFFLFFPPNVYYCARRCNVLALKFHCTWCCCPALPMLLTMMTAMMKTTTAATALMVMTVMIPTLQYYDACYCYCCCCFKITSCLLSCFRVTILYILFCHIGTAKPRDGAQSAAQTKGNHIRATFIQKFPV